jgi:ribonuclease BN (tRNA processing enzyme)
MLCVRTAGKMMRPWMTKLKTYSELRNLNTFSQRYNYLKLTGSVGESTFGGNRYLNQVLYRSKEWKQVRDEVIIRDHGCDLAVEGYEIHERIIVHHMNPITIEDIEQRRPEVLDPQFLITTTHNTHLAIHFSDESMLPQPLVVRSKNDTSPWKQ